MLPKDEQIALLVGNGVQPSIAEWLIDQDDKADHKILDGRTYSHMTAITEQDIEVAASGWYYDPAVPNEIKRMLDAGIA